MNGGGGKRRGYRNGYYERDFVTRFGNDPAAHRAHPRTRTFCRLGWRRFQRRAEEVSMLIREAFLRGISDAPGGTGGGHADRRNGERANGFDADPGSG